MKNKPDHKKRHAHLLSSGKETGGTGSESAIEQDDAGRMRWIYEFSFWRNPTILITTWKVLLLACLAPALLMFFLSLGDGFGHAIRIFLTIMAYGIIFLSLLLSIAYLFIGLLYGGKYVVLFLMDDKGVTHIQLKQQFKKARALGLLTTLAGVSSASASTAGAGLLSASRQSLHTDFSKVKSVIVREKRSTIYINESFSRNQVYAETQDFPFIVDFILSKVSQETRIRKK